MENGLNFKPIDISWLEIVKKSLAKVDKHYIHQLEENATWLPGRDKIFNAFSLPLPKVNFILFGESPYPRAVSANGFAFWDANVKSLWSENGLSKEVNRATSLRNLVKMLLLADSHLEHQDTTQEAIAKIDKQTFINSAEDLFKNLLRQGVLLLNASLVLSEQPVKVDAKAWQPFINELLEQLSRVRPDIKLILLGNIAKAIDKLPAARNFSHFYAEHPYNLSFVTNPKVIDFFQPMKLLYPVEELCQPC